jgi:hypothetical protein
MAATPTTTTTEAAVFLPQKHARYFKFCLSLLPSRVQNQDSNRMTLVFFALSGLDFLGQLDAMVKTKSEIADWIYAQQVSTTSPAYNTMVAHSPYTDRCCHLQRARPQTISGSGAAPFSDTSSPRAAVATQWPPCFWRVGTWP